MWKESNRLIMNIIKVTKVQECKECDHLLEKLIKYESAIDGKINGDTTISSFYERSLQKDDSVIYACEENGNLCGFIMAYVSKNTSFVLPIINIMSIYIDTDYREKGIGKSLMQEVEKWAKEKYEKFMIELNCISNNLKALNFYKELGYDEVRVTMRKIINEGDNKNEMA